MATAPVEGWLLKFPTGARDRLSVAGAEVLRAADTAFDLEPLLEGAPPPGAALTAAGPVDHEWFIARPRVDASKLPNPWDVAYELMQPARSLGAVGAAPTIVEPDFTQDWDHGRIAHTDASMALTGGFDDQDSHGGKVPTVPGRFAWHLDDDFSQLRTARGRAAKDGSPEVVRIAHLDTGYDPEHATFPKDRIEKALQRNFIDNASLQKDARDRGISGVLKQPGHGTGTLSILAGARFTFSNNDYQFNEELGGAPHARIVPIRVGNSVVQLKTSSVARGIRYAAALCNDPNERVDVISMSMGGLASAAWADAVNAAYEAGIVFVAAAGNNFSGLPTRFIIFPARFKRVIAVCGAMADGRPYYDLPVGVMQGCWGPKRKMATAMSAYTPNAPWAEMGASDIVDMNGAGTSSATPQVAAAAALYLQRHHAELFDAGRYARPWMRVEAVRHALFTAASAEGDLSRLGHGTLRADDALDVRPADPRRLERTPEDRATFAFLRALTGLGAASSPIDRMLQLEATQLLQRWPKDAGPNPLEEAIEDPDAELHEIPRAQVRGYLEALQDHPAATATLKQRADQLRRELGGRPVVRVPSKPPAEEKSVAPLPRPLPGPLRERKFTPPTPPYRPLRTYALDPSLAHSLDTFGISEMICQVPWEKLEPGPRGEYLEVIDLDPASGSFYEPVDLDNPMVLVQNGLPPSEGTPQFHQQMVYAVAMSTIANFEYALGRKALWRPGPSPDPDRPRRDSHYVRRLRIYPHALREANAYYSPDKIALLFGYFSAGSDDPGGHLPGGRVFSCLSHDIIAHETTHALLDGMHRRFLLPTNPDVRAFHEAFADIVALFQHFTFPEVLRHQIAQTRGNIRKRESFFGNLAVQFGKGRGMDGPLRRAIGEMKDGKWVPYEPDPADYQNIGAPHERGAILVAAVFDAFLSIYDRRVADLLRLATGGTGILGDGAIHPDLVNRLAAEAAKAAQHVLTMCIRALDYCPPTDITFSDYLRAILTADYDVLKDDALDYRVAFVEAFRRRGIYPPDLRTLGVESLLWREPEQDDPPRPEVLKDVLHRLGRYATAMLYARDREEIFKLQYHMRRNLKIWLHRQFMSGDEGAADAEFLGLEVPKGDGQRKDGDGSDAREKALRPMRFEVHTARIAHRANPDGSVEPRLVLGLLQERRLPIDESNPADTMTFEGGCTIVAELRTPRVMYCIRKRIGSENRLRAQREFAAASDQSVRAVYLGVGPLRDGGVEGKEPFALLHRGS